ncbi:penicillin-binding protein 1C [Pseudaestuariivita atlantica]|uniref:peptidoglycan glycosyltransferase n=1 Tax=Pseudaestuariivita atlantica TaxID=1317121 RepID=A0A0L1JQ12_9RHOB|nr:penicillin-binding protein 1C [Pseudaestuariivita atlantica]KNG93826.1 penicillin-binding protein [Pseudaestuariivita atlantica]
MRRHAVLVAALALWALGAGLDAARDWIDATVLPPLVAETSVEVRDRDGLLLRAFTVEDGRWRLAVHRAQVDPDYLKMLVRYEDKRFYRHGGVDPVALARAAVLSLWHGRVVSGGSTLTMQVARLLENSGTGRMAGKLRQVRLALKLERVMSKDEILGLYLLHAPYGGNLEGVRAATLAYFGREPARLTPAEAALLVALPQAPEARRPDRRPEAARAARLRVLARLHEAGLIADETLAVADREPFPEGRTPFPTLAAHLAERAREAEPTWPRHDLTVERGLQVALEKLAAQTAREAGRRLSVAIVVADHGTGEVLASVGSAGYRDEAREGFVDMTQAKRSPGSTLKPFVYALAFDRGLAHPETLIDDRPVDFDGYAPQNFDGVYRGELHVAEALRLSLNTPVVQVAQALGPAHLMSALTRTGATPELQGEAAGLAVVLGGVGLTLEELTRAYAALARMGETAPWHWRKGAEGPAPRRLVERRAAWQVGHVLADLPPPPGSVPWRFAYKTGTSYGHRDAWALGWDGRHVVGVWVGRPDGTPVPGAFGADIAAPLLFAAFERVKPEVDPLPAPPPETLIVAQDRLPAPLQRFRPRGEVARTDGPKLAFPPDGARVALDRGALTVKVRGGRAPFLWLANGAPVGARDHRLERVLDGLGRGWTEVTVIDADGRAARARVELTE